MNETVVPAYWQLNYVKFPQKQTIGYMTQTIYEKENEISKDDPEVFSFSVTSGRLKGPSLKLWISPEGLAIPSLPKSKEEEEFLPQKIQIQFKPKQNILYKSKFRFTCKNGISCDLIVKGQGSYEENYDVV